MKRKMYEIILPPNTAAVFWEKDGKMYHDQDPLHPFPYDEMFSSRRYSSLTGQITGQVHTLYPLFNRVLVPLMGMNNDIKEMVAFARETLVWADTQFESNDLNLIIVHRKINNDTILIGSFMRNVITDRPINWLE